MACLLLQQFHYSSAGVLLKGNDSSADLPTVANVQFHLTCMESVNVDHAIFFPNSSRANLTGIYVVSNTNETLGPFQLSTGFTTGGYWDLLNNSQRQTTPVINNQNPPLPPTASAFVPGVYTVAVADEWGQEVILHFIVVKG